MSKIIESCMLLQLSGHCREHDLQLDYQSAYREHYSCETTLLQLSDNILWGMEKQLVTSLVTLDLPAAFDTVDHDILLLIFKCKYDIDNKALQWFNEYLHPISFKVAIDGCYSTEHNLVVSVPQGSCVGANIFNLYCSPLQDSCAQRLTTKWFH